jgi:flagellar biosynthesis/type III secretory pathway protein FliH
VLTVLAHPTMEIGRAVLHLLRRAPPEREMLYLDMVMKALVDVHGSAAEELMENSGYEFQSSFFRRKLEQCIEQGMAQGIEQGIERGIEQGIERGIEQGIERGIAQGERKGRLAALQQVAFELAAGKLGSRPAALASSIDEIDDASVLTSLVVALGQAHGAEEVRAAVAQARQAPALSTPG